MNGMLPENLRRPNSEPKELISSEEAEDIRIMLEALVENQARIAETLDEAKAPVQQVKITGAAAFWNGLFSVWGAIIGTNLVIWSSLAIQAIFGN